MTARIIAFPARGTGSTITTDHGQATITRLPVAARSANPLSLTGANTGPDIDIPRQGLVGGEPKPRVDPPACPKIAGGIFADHGNATALSSARTCERCAVPQVGGERAPLSAIEGRSGMTDRGADDVVDHAIVRTDDTKTSRIHS